MSDPKGIVLNIYRQLVQRRLLPVAILLIGAIVAIPVLLAKNPPAAPAPAPVKKDASTETAATAQPIVSLVTDPTSGKRRRVLGTRKNPFSPAPIKIAPVKTATSVAPASSPSAPSLASTGGSSSSSSGGGSAPAPASPAPVSSSPSTPVVAPAPKKKYELYSISVRFGDSSAPTLDKFNVGRDKPLPDAKDPLLVYLGVEKGAKRAIFLVDASVTPQGDGTCNPSPADCETIHLHEGDTEFFDVKDASGKVTDQYELDLVKIRTTSTTSAARAAKARASVSAAGRRALRAHVTKIGPLRYRYDSATGTVIRLADKAFKAAVASASHKFSL